MCSQEICIAEPKVKLMSWRGSDTTAESRSYETAVGQVNLGKIVESAEMVTMAWTEYWMG